MNVAETKSLPVSRQSTAPLYDQLRVAVVEIIEREKLRPGDLLPSEHQLCTDFGVSRTVVRQALALLELDGVVQRVRGKGTFVAAEKTGERVGHSLLGLYEDVKSRGSVIRSDVLRHSVIPATAEIALVLEVEEGSAVVELERLRFVDDEPWALSTAWLPEEIGRHTLDADMGTESLYGVLDAHGVVGVTGFRSVEAVLADCRTGELLGVDEGSALLKLKSLRRDARGIPIDYFEAYHRGDRSRFEFQLTKNASSTRILTEP